MDALGSNASAQAVLDHRQPVVENRSEDFHHLPIAKSAESVSLRRIFSVAEGETQSLNGAPFLRRRACGPEPERNARMQ